MPVTTGACPCRLKSDFLSVRLRQRLVQTAREWDDKSHYTGEAFWQRRADLGLDS